MAAGTGGTLAGLLAGQGEAWVGAGSGWASYADRLLADSGVTLHSRLDECFPSAEVIAKLAVDEFKAGNTLPAAQAIPVYLRNDVAKKPKPVVL